MLQIRKIIEDQAKTKLPDIALEREKDFAKKLDKVGMTHVELPIRVSDGIGLSVLTPAMVNCFVSLDCPEAKGIHMSRLYLILNHYLVEKEFSFQLLDEILVQFIQSHEGLSEKAYIDISFDLMIRRPALMSHNWGWRKYPITIKGVLEKGKKTEFELEMEILYSSTCPCSAALSRQLIQESFRSQFPNQVVLQEDVYQWLGSKEGMIATPHSQRSRANVKVKFQESSRFAKIVPLIDLLEKTLQTPVQAAVKREDEQEFARLNGRHLMFCEDAARLIGAALNNENEIIDYWVKVSHEESLHPHNAVSIITKGETEGGRDNEFKQFLE